MSYSRNYNIYVITNTLTYNLFLFLFQTKRKKHFFRPLKKFTIKKLLQETKKCSDKVLVKTLFSGKLCSFRQKK